VAASYISAKFIDLTAKYPSKSVLSYIEKSILVDMGSDLGDKQHCQDVDQSMKLLIIWIPIRWLSPESVDLRFNGRELFCIFRNAPNEDVLGYEIVYVSDGPIIDKRNELLNPLPDMTRVHPLHGGR
jgi:hypothetical protein